MLSLGTAFGGFRAAGHPAASLIFYLTLAVWILGEVRQSRRQRAHATEADGGSRDLLRVTIGLGWFLAFFAVSTVPGADIGHHRLAVFVVAMIVLWAGIGLRFWAFRTLGEYFTFNVMTSADQTVISAGPYRLIRHPSYAGGALAMAGVGLAMDNWVSLAALVIVPLVGTINRIKVEESALVAALGPRYKDFAAGRKRLVPFVW